MRRCPDTGLNCFDPACAHGCAGYDVHIEAVTVVHTTIKRKVVVSLVAGGGYQPKQIAGEPKPPPRKP